MLINVNKEQNRRVYFDKNLNKNYIITGNNNDLTISYDYDNNKIYNKYYENECIFYYSFINDIRINENNELIYLITLNFFDGVKIYDFHSRKLINKINPGLGGKNTMFLWSNKYLFIGFNEIIKLFDIKSLKNIRNLKGHKNQVININKCVHPLYGECLISQGIDDDEIKLWTI